MTPVARVTLSLRIMLVAMCLMLLADFVYGLSELGLALVLGGSYILLGAGALYIRFRP